MSSVVIKQSLVPMITFYVVIMLVLAVGLRMSRRAARQGGSGTVRDATRAAGRPRADPPAGSFSAAGPAAAGLSPASPGDTSGSLAGATASAPGTGAAAPGAPGSGLERAGGWRTLLRPGPGWPRLGVQYARTVLGGYLLLMAVVVIYYFGVARVGGNFIESAFTGCALLVGLSTPVFFLISWLTTRRS